MRRMSATTAAAVTAAAARGRQVRASHRERALARGHAPAAARPMVIDDDRLAVERDGRADVPRARRSTRHRPRSRAACGVSTTRCSSLCITAVASGRFRTGRAGAGSRPRAALWPRSRHKRWASGLAHDAREHERRRTERQVGQLRRRSRRPRTRTCRDCTRRPAAARAWGTWACRRPRRAGREDRCLRVVPRAARRARTPASEAALPGRYISVADVTVVGVQSARRNAWQPGEGGVERRCAVVRRDARPVHPRVHVQKQIRSREPRSPERLGHADAPPLRRPRGPRTPSAGTWPPAATGG